MSGNQMILLGGTPQAVPVDPYFYSVTSLLHGDGTNGGQNNTFLDSSSNNFTITRNGNTTQGSFSPFSQTGWSNYFDGSGDGISFGSNVNTNPASSDITVEAWIYPLAYNSYGPIFSNDVNGGFHFGKIASGFGVRHYGTGDVVFTATTPALNQWTHVAVSRSGNSWYLFYNGIQVATATASNSFTQGTACVGGNASTAAEAWNGYLSNVRFVKGTALYTSNFTPSTTPLTAVSNTQLLTCQSNRFKDNSSNAYAATVFGTPSVQPFSPFNPTTAYSTSAVGGSGYFDGSGDYLALPSSSNLALGTGDFCIETWVYGTVAAVSGLIGNSTSAGDGDAQYELQIGTSYYPKFIGWNSVFLTSSSVITFNQWNHLAVTRSGTTCSMFLNGTRVATATVSQNFSSTNALNIGRQAAASSPFTGYLSGTRIVKGSSVYDPTQTTCTVPTAPPTAITNTQLLCNFTNAGIFDNAAVADYETVGNTQISTSVKKYGTGSMYFDGTGDYLVTDAPTTVPMAFGTGDFTIECWLYRSASASFQIIFDFRKDAATDIAPLVYLVSGVPYYYTASNDRINGGITLSNNTWYHLALCRVASQTKLFINGTQVGATYADTNNYVGKLGRPTIGAEGVSVGASPFTGYIDDVRITKGVGRYPYNFTPPTAEFPNIGGTVTLTADPYYDYTTLLLPGNGTNGAQNNTFLDSSTNNFTITRNGNTTQGTFSPFSQTGWGAYFNGSSDYISVADSADFTMGSGDFTIQCWVYSTANSGSDQYILGQVPSTGAAASTSFQLYKKATTNVAECYVYIGGAKVATSTATIPVGQWTHLAMVRDGGTMRLYVNGSQNGTNATLSTSSIVDSTGSFSVGRTGDYNGLYFAGYVSNVSVVKGTCLFPNGTTFTPSTTPLSTSTSGQSVLLCQANRFIDTNTATTAKTVTVGSTASIQAFSPFNPTAAWSAATNGGSGYFDGSGDFLTAADSTAWDLSGDYTIEMWLYVTSTPSSPTFFQLGESSNYLLWYLASATKYLTLAGSASITASTAMSLNAWNHVALVRSGGGTNNTVMYLNGVNVGQTTNTTSFTGSASNGVRIGAEYPSGFYVNGYISDVRIVKGTAVYTGAFTPPTAPLTAITNTQLLTNFTNAGIYDATAKNDLETVGNAQISTTQSKFGGSSMYFDGTGDWLVTAYRPQLDIASGDWTVECWVYPTSVATKTVFAINSASSSYAQVQVATSSGGAWYLLVGTGATTWLSSSTGGSYSANNWYHVAAVRYGSNFNLYINGASVLAQSSSSNLYAYNSATYLGADGALLQNFGGYIDDLRVTKGIARYTSNFTPPTTAFLTL